MAGTQHGGSFLPPINTAPNNLEKSAYRLSQQASLFGENTSLEDTNKVKLVPVFNVKITDEDLGVLTGSKLHEINLQKVQYLLTDQLTSRLVDRHCNSLKKVCRHYERGFLLYDGPIIGDILLTCSDQVTDRPVYIEHIINFLKLISLSMMKMRSSDEALHENGIIEMMTNLALLTSSANAEIVLAVSNMFEKLLLGRISHPNGGDSGFPEGYVEPYSGCERCSTHYNTYVIGKSKAAAVLLTALLTFINETEGTGHIGQGDQAFMNEASTTNDRVIFVHARQALLSALQVMIREAPDCVNVILECNGAGLLAQKLRGAGLKSGQDADFVFRSVELLWRLLELCQPIDANTPDPITLQLTQQECLIAFREIFCDTLRYHHSIWHRQLRNDILAIVSCLISRFPQAPFLETGLTKLLVALTGFPEVKTSMAPIASLKLGTSAEDFEFKKQLFSIVTLLAQDPQCLAVMTQQSLLAAMFSFVRPGASAARTSTQSDPYTWTSGQLEELQLHAMGSLASLAPKLINDYLEVKGGNRLLNILEWAMREEEEYLGSGNSFYGAGGHHCKRALLRYCVRLLVQVVGTRSPAVASDLIDQEAVPLLTETVQMLIARFLPTSPSQSSNEMACLLPTASNQTNSNKAPTGKKTTTTTSHSTKPLTQKSYKTSPNTAYSSTNNGAMKAGDLEVIDIEIAGDCLVVLAGLCEGNSHVKGQFAESGGVDILTTILKETPKRIGSGLGHHRLLVCAIDAVWSCIVAGDQTETLFLEKEGIFLLLDLVQSAPHALQSLVLGCLLDLVENPRSIPHFMAWRGKPNAVTLQTVLCQLWRNEESQMGVARTVEGCIGDPYHPLTPSPAQLRVIQSLADPPMQKSPVDSELEFLIEPKSTAGMEREESGYETSPRSHHGRSDKTPTRGDVEATENDAPTPNCDEDSIGKEVVEIDVSTIEDDGQNSSAIVEIFENIRAKVYALSVRLGLTNGDEGTTEDSAGARAASGVIGANEEDAITKVLINGWLDLKIGEVWIQISDDLAAQKIEPLDHHREALDLIKEACVDKAALLQTHQLKLVESQKKQDSHSEAAFFSSLRENQRQRQRAFDRYTDLLMRTSNFAALKQAKDRQIEAIKESRHADATRLKTQTQQSRHKPQVPIVYHDSDLLNDNCHITTVPGRKIMVDSIPPALNGGRVRVFLENYAVGGENDGNSNQVASTTTANSQRTIQTQPKGVRIQAMVDKVAESA